MAVFGVTFFATHKLVPIIVPLGDFSGAAFSTIFPWLFGSRSGLIAIGQIVLMLVLCAWPLRRLRLLFCFLYSVACGLVLGFTAFPYDVVELGYLKYNHPILAPIIWVTMVAIPWLVPKSEIVPGSKK